MATLVEGYNRYSVSSAPPWLQQPNGQTWNEALGIALDIRVDAARKAVLARLPELAPSDALPVLASERQLEQMPGETEATWATRLVGAWDAWVWAGTKKGVVDNIRLTGLTNVTLYESWDWPDASGGEWARFWVVIGQPHPWVSDGTWGSAGSRPVYSRRLGTYQAVWGDGGTWGSSASPDEVARVLRQVRLWKPAHARCVAVDVMLAGELWGAPTGTWDEAGTWGAAAAEWRP